MKYFDFFNQPWNATKDVTLKDGDEFTPDLSMALYS